MAVSRRAETPRRDPVTVVVNPLLLEPGKPHPRPRNLALPGLLPPPVGIHRISYPSRESLLRNRLPPRLSVLAVDSNLFFTGVPPLPHVGQRRPLPRDPRLPIQVQVLLQLLNRPVVSKSSSTEVHPNSFILISGRIESKFKGLQPPALRRPVLFHVPIIKQAGFSRNHQISVQ